MDRERDESAPVTAGDGVAGLSLPRERDGTLAMVWPAGASPCGPSPAASGYSLRLGVDRGAFEAVQASIGFDVTAAHWSSLEVCLLGEAMAFAVTEAGEPVAAAAVERRAPGWAELGWVAVAPRHRRRNLSRSLCALLITDVVAHAEARLFGSTQDARLAALSTYVSLGFHPVHRPEKVERWRAVYAQLQAPYTPERWGWPVQADTFVR